MTHGIDFLLDQYCVLICMHRMALASILFVFLIYNMEQASLPISSSLYVFVVLYMCVSGLARLAGKKRERKRETTTPCLRFVSFSWVWVRSVVQVRIYSFAWAVVVSPRGL